MPVERRQYPRRRAKITATLVVDGGVERAPVSITDISEAGARVQLSAPITVWGELYMLVPDHTLQPCRLVWHQDGTMGLSFSP